MFFLLYFTENERNRRGRMDVGMSHSLILWTCLLKAEIAGHSIYNSINSSFPVLKAGQSLFL